MVISFGTNLASMQGVRRLGFATQELGAVYERLGSGQRINRASDDAAGLAVASSLQVNARILNQALQNVSYGISLLSIADSATNSLRDILTRQIELSEQSANGVLSDMQRAALDSEAQALRGEYQRIIATTSYNDLGLLNGELAKLQIQAGLGAEATLSLDLLVEKDQLVEFEQNLNMINPTATIPYGVGISTSSFGETRLLVAPREGDTDLLIALSIVTFDTINRTGLLFQSFGVNEEGELEFLAQQGIVSPHVPGLTLDASLKARVSDDGYLEIEFQVNNSNDQTYWQINANGQFGMPGTILGGVVDASSTQVSGNFTGLADGESVEALAQGAGGIPFTARLNRSEFSLQKLDQMSFSLQTQQSSLTALDRLQAQLEDLSGVRSRIGAAESRLEVASSIVSSSREQSLLAASRIMDADIAQEVADMVRLSILQNSAAAVLAQSNLQPEIALTLLISG